MESFDALISVASAGVVFGFGLCYIVDLLSWFIRQMLSLFKY